MQFKGCNVNVQDEKLTKSQFIHSTAEIFMSQDLNKSYYPGSPRLAEYIIMNTIRTFQLCQPKNP